MDAKRLLDQLTGAGNGDVRVRRGQEHNLGSLLQGLAGAQGSGGLGALLGGLTGGRSGAGTGGQATPGMGAPAAGGSAGGHGGTPMGGGATGGMGGSRSGYGDPADRVGDNRNMAGGVGGAGGDIGSMLSGALGPGGLLSGGAGKGALAAGLIGMLMKSGKPKRMMSSGLKLGGLALIGGLAYKAYQDYQAGQKAQPQAAIEPPPTDSAFAPSSPQEEQDHARAIIRAMVGAAKADGHVDADEQQRLFGAIDTLDLDNDDKAFLMDELRGSVSATDVAREAQTPELAAELYVASLLVIDEVDPQERRYLDDLARAMNLDRALAERLERQVAVAQEA